MHSISSARTHLVQPSMELSLQAGRRYLAIRPIIDPADFPTTWAGCGDGKVKVIGLIAETHKVAPRTVYNWLTRWKSGGITALEQKVRRDCGKPRLLTQPAHDYLRAALQADMHTRARKSVRAIFRLYQAEMGAAVPAVSYTTFRSWIRAIRSDEARGRIVFMGRRAAGGMS